MFWRHSWTGAVLILAPYHLGVTFSSRPPPLIGLIETVSMSLIMEMISDLHLWFMWDELSFLIQVFQMKSQKLDPAIVN